MAIPTPEMYRLLGSLLQNEMDHLVSDLLGSSSGRRDDHDARHPPSPPPTPRNAPPSLFGGMRIIEDPNMVDTREDWSDVRSAGRARRRRKLGHPQRIRIVGSPKTEAYRIGDTLVMHPALAAEMRRAISPQS